MALWSRFFGSAGSQAVGVALGTTAVPALLPAAQYLVNEAWDKYPDRPLIAAQLAAGVAAGKIDRDWATGEARLSGIDKKRFDALVAAATTGPGISEAFNLWRRGEIDEDGFRRAAKREGLAQEWIDALVQSKIERLTPAQVALGIVRSIIDDKGLLVTKLDTGPGKVARYPVSPIDPLTEAEAAGIDQERLRVMVGEIGEPMAAGSAAESYFRGLIDKTDYNAAIAEGDIRPEWADPILEHARQIPTARDFIENALRGYRSLSDAQQGAALHGMSPEHSRLIFQNSGRPLNLHQITQAEAWGASYNPLPGNDPNPYMNSVLIGSVTPAYYEMQDALKYNLPSAFFFRVLQTQGVLTESEAVVWYKRLGWPDELAKKVAAAFAQGAGAGADSWTKRAQTQLWGTLHRSFLNAETEADEALDRLNFLGLDQAARDAVLEVWTLERDLTRKQLTPSQVKKAWQKAVVNPVTAQPWTKDEATEALLARGYLLPNALTFLET